MTQEKTHWKKWRNPTYLGAWDFQPNEVKLLFCVGVEREEVSDFSSGREKKELCTVAYFHKHKPMILNVTNSKAFQAVTGSGFIEDWEGRHVNAHVQKIKHKKEWVEAVRLIPTTPDLDEMTPNHPNWAKALEAIKSGKAEIVDVLAKYLITEENRKLLGGE